MSSCVVVKSYELQMYNLDVCFKSIFLLMVSFSHPSVYSLVFVSGLLVRFIVRVLLLARHLYTVYTLYKYGVFIVF